MQDSLGVDKPQINGIIVVGDSLSDERKKYNEYIWGCFPFKWILHASDYNNFTNGHTWAYILNNTLSNKVKENLTWLKTKDKGPAYQFNFFKNVAEGGATSADYRNLSGFFRYFKGFILSFFLGNIQKQAKEAKKDKNMLHPNKLGIVFAGANDLVTLGYADEQGVNRAVHGVSKTVKILAKRSEEIGLNYLKHLLLIGLPDISETPRFAYKSQQEKDFMKSACQKYNQRLQELANEYQYIDFDFCTIYKFKNINLLELSQIKQIKKGVVLVGEGIKREILFINNGEFIFNKSNKEFKSVNVSLTKEQLVIFSERDGEVKIKLKRRIEFINSVTEKAKLDLDIKMLDIGIIFDKICKNPADYGFTAGCAVYYLNQPDKQKGDEELILNKVTPGNAIIIKEINSKFFSYIIKNGHLIKKEAKAVLQEFDLSGEPLDKLKKKLKQFSTEEGIIQLAAMESKHDICIIEIIQSVVNCFKKTFQEEISLTAIDESVLESIKKGFPNRDDIFWDDLHPARRVHEILASEISRFVDKAYLLDGTLRFRDDSAIGGSRPKLCPNSPNEAPASLSSKSSLMLRV